MEREVLPPQNMAPIEVLSIKIKSSNHKLFVKSLGDDCSRTEFADSMGVCFWDGGSFHLNLGAAEAEALGKALIECAEHYRAMIARLER